MAIKLQNNYTNSDNLISIVEIYFLICHLIYCVSFFFPICHIDNYFQYIFSQVECKRAQPKESVLGGTSVALMGKRILLKYDQDGLVGHRHRRIWPLEKKAPILCRKWDCQTTHNCLLVSFIEDRKRFHFLLKNQTGHRHSLHFRSCFHIMSALLPAP